MYSVSMVLGLFQFAIVLCRLMSLHWHWHCFELLLWFAFNPSKIEYYYTEFSGWIENIYASRHQEQHTYTGWKQGIAMQSCKSAPSCSSNFETDLYFSLVPSFFYPFLSLHSISIFCLFLLFFLFFFSRYFHSVICINCIRVSLKTLEFLPVGSHIRHCRWIAVVSVFKQ